MAAYWSQTGALSCIVAFPEQPSLEERGLRDGCGRLYRDCADRGELLTLGQRATDVPAHLRAAMGRTGLRLPVMGLKRFAMPSPGRSRHCQRSFAAR